MREEDELLNRTLQRCLREVRKALDADPDVRALAACKARSVWKSLHNAACLYSAWWPWARPGLWTLDHGRTPSNPSKQPVSASTCYPHEHISFYISSLHMHNFVQHSFGSAQSLAFFVLPL